MYIKLFKKKIKLFIFLTFIFMFSHIYIWKNVILNDKPIFANDYHQIYNTYEYHKQLFLKKELSFWHPLIHCGVTNSSEAQNLSSYYPLNLLIYLSDYTGNGLKLFFIIHFFIAFAGFFYLLKKFDFNIPSSIFGALIYSLWLKTYIILLDGGNLSIISIALFPLMFLSIHSLLKYQSIKNFILATIILALNISGGHPQFTVYFTYFFLIYILFFYFNTKSEKKKQLNFLSNLKYLSKLYFFFFAVLILSAILNSHIILPTLSDNIIYKDTIRANSSYTGFNLAYSLAPYYLSTLIFPQFLGIDILGTGKYIGSFMEYNLYIGYLPILFLILFIFYTKKNTFYYFLIFISLLALILSFGKYSSLTSAILKYIPLLKVFRTPSKFIFFLFLAVSFFTADVFNNILQKKYSIKIYLKAIILYVFFALILYSLFNHFISASNFHHILLNSDLKIFLIKTIFAVLIIFLMFNKLKFKTIKYLIPFLFIIFQIIDINSILRELIEPIPSENYTNNTFWKKFKSEHSNEPNYNYRVLMMSSNRCSTLPQNIFSVSGAMTDTRLDKYNDIVKIIQNIPYDNHQIMGLEINNYTHPLIDMLNVKYIFSRKKLNNKKLTLLKNPVSLYGWDFYAVEKWPYYLYYNNKAYPRFWVVDHYITIYDKKRRLNFIKTQQPNLKKVAILNQQIDIENQKPKDNLQYSCKILKYSNDLISLKVNSNKNALLVSSEVFKHNWQCFAAKSFSGEKMKIKVYNVNHAFRGAEIKKGNNYITFKYNKFLPKSGLIISFIISSILLILLIMNLNAPVHHIENIYSIKTVNKKIFIILISLTLLILLSLKYNLIMSNFKKNFVDRDISKKHISNIITNYNKYGWHKLVKRFRKSIRYQ